MTFRALALRRSESKLNEMCKILLRCAFPDWARKMLKYYNLESHKVAKFQK